MRIPTGLSSVLPVILLALALPAAAQTPASAPASRPSAPASELKAEVPALNAFHEVIAELWHTAWPAKDVARIRELLPRVQKDFQAVGQAELPGILRDRRADWDAGLKLMAAAIADYEKAAAGTDPQPLLDAVEKLHARFEAQMRVIRPHMRELEAYHVFLYQVYHSYAPAQQIGPLRAAADSLQARCSILGAAQPPAWFQGDVPRLKAEIGVLCNQTSLLTATLRSADWTRIQRAVEAVHSQYLKVEQVFD